MSFQDDLTKALTSLILPQDIVLSEDTKKHIDGVIAELKFAKVLATIGNMEQDEIGTDDLYKILQQLLEQEEEDPAEIKEKAEHLLADEGFIQSLAQELKEFGKSLVRSGAELRRSYETAQDAEGVGPYEDFGGGAFSKLVAAHPELDTDEFREYVACHNKADRDSGELDDIAASELERLVGEYVV